MSEVPVYLFDVDLAFLAPDPVEPPPALVTNLDLLPFDSGESELNLEPFAGD